jgi:predicted PurR-regulated permease PerM
MLSLLDYSKRIFLAVVIIIATLLIPYLLYKVLPHFVPFILAFLTAVFLEPISLFFAKKLKIKKTLAHTVTYLLFLGTILLLSYLIINKIYVQLVGLLSFIQDNGPLIQAWVMNVTQSVQDTISMLPYNAGDQINQIIIEYIDGISHINVASKLLAYTYSLSTAIPNFFLLTLIYLISVILFQFPTG